MLSHTLAFALEEAAAPGEAQETRVTENAHPGLQGKLSQRPRCTRQRWQPHSVTQSSLVTERTPRDYVGLDIYIHNPTVPR